VPRSWDTIHRLITEHLIPEGFVLRHTGRNHGDLTIRLVRRDAARQTISAF
jgi:hypothetical protein